MARVLVIDDDELVLSTILDLLRDRHDVVGIRGGEEAIAAVRRRDYDVLVTDVCMPNVAIWQVIRSLRRDGCTTPIIACSGGTTALPADSALRLCTAFGATRTLRKPFRRAELLRLIDEVLPGTKA